MKKIKIFYLDLCSTIKTRKQLFFTVLLPCSIIFCCTLFFLNGVFVAALGSRPQVLAVAPSIQEGLAKQLLRLHVIANSDSACDQEAKQIVKNGLVVYMESFLAEVDSKEDAMNEISYHIPELQEEATKILRELGYHYNVTISLGPATFPIKVYGDITLPAGEYDALRVQLGEAKGKNWWCILFPNLCYVDTTHQIVPEDSKHKLQAILTEEEYHAITKKTGKTKVEVKFKLWEWFQDLF